MKSLAESPWVHVLLVVATSIGFESLFVHHSLNLLDEGWPLIAAMGLHAGGDLYGEVFWVFPPGHVLSAWLAYALDPPGVVLARIFYAGFVVALCASVYALGRRLMPSGWALFGAMLLAVAATSAHRYQLVFGYRYLVFAVLVLLAFARRIEAGDVRWTFVAGLFAGVSLFFRLTPAFAVSLGVAIAIVTLDRSWRVWLRDWVAYGAGVLLVIVPVIAWFAAGVGVEALWREVVVRPVVMTDLQSLPMPALAWSPRSDTRRSLMSWGAAWQFRLYLLLYLCYAVVLGGAWLRALRAGRPFAHPLLLAFTVFGGVFFVRTLGRSDAAHLYSAIPPVCLVLAHALHRLLAWRPGSGAFVPRAPALQLGAAAVAFGSWMLFMGGDVFLDPVNRGVVPVRSLDGRVGVNSEQYAGMVDRMVELIHRYSTPDDVVLDLSASPLLQVIAGRRGPGNRDLIMPGTFLDESEEREFIARLAAEPPALVIWPDQPFDELPERRVGRTAPELVRWVRTNYRDGPKTQFARRGRSRDRFTVMLPRESPALRGSLRDSPRDSLRDSPAPGGARRRPR